MSSYKIGVNLRVTENSNQGGRKYMEDTHAIRFVKNDEGGFEFAYFGIFDGHGGAEASKFARDHLLDEITKYDSFWSEDDDEILEAIKTGFLDTHCAMWKEVDKWPRTLSGLPSTSGTTASIAIIKNSKLYIGHVGDSGVAMGFDDSRCEKFIRPHGSMLTTDHKPESPSEKKRIEECGGQVVAKAGVQRVVWNRPKVSHKGPIRRSTPIDKIPFLAVSRSLGDLWSYNYLNQQFVVSPEPEVSVRKLDPTRDKCLVIGSDGLWNMLSAEEAVSLVVDLEYHFEYKVINDPNVSVSYWINPAEKLVNRAINKWRAKLMKADNTSAIVVLIDPLGPRKLSILKKKREETFRKLREARAAEASKVNTRSSPRKSNDNTPEPSSPKISSKVHAAKVEKSQKHQIEEELGISVGIKTAISPISLEKMRRRSIPGQLDTELDDSIQATSVHKNLFSDMARIKPTDHNVTHVPKSTKNSENAHSSSNKHTDNSKLVKDEKSSTVVSPRKVSSCSRTEETSTLVGSSPRKLSPCTRTRLRSHSGDTSNHVDANVLQDNKTTKEQTNIHITKISVHHVLKDSQKIHQLNSEHDGETSSLKDMKNIITVTEEKAELRLKSSTDLNRNPKPHLNSNRDSFSDSPSKNLRRTSLKGLSDVKNNQRTSARLRKVKQNHKRRGENSRFITRTRFGAQKRKLETHDDLPSSKRVCRN